MEATVEPLVARVIGVAASDITRAESPAGESALGNLIADSQRIRTNVQFTFMNPGGVRDELRAGEVTWGGLFAIQPFGNDLVSLDLTGAQIRTLLEQQWVNQAVPRIPESSAKIESVPVRAFELGTYPHFPVTLDYARRSVPYSANCRARANDTDGCVSGNVGKSRAQMPAPAPISCS